MYELRLNTVSVLLELNDDIPLADRTLLPDHERINRLELSYRHVAWERLKQLATVDNEGFGDTPDLE